MCHPTSARGVPLYVCVYILRFRSSLSGRIFFRDPMAPGGVSTFTHTNSLLKGFGVWEAFACCFFFFFSHFLKHWFLHSFVLVVWAGTALGLWETQFSINFNKHRLPGEFGSFRVRVCMFVKPVRFGVFLCECV